jgi:hypothetical protein
MFDGEPSRGLDRRSMDASLTRGGDAMAGLTDLRRQTLLAQVPGDEDRPGDGPRPGREPPDEPPPGDHGPDPDEPVIDETIGAGRSDGG